MKGSGVVVPTPDPHGGLKDRLDPGGGVRFNESGTSRVRVKYFRVGISTPPHKSSSLGSQDGRVIGRVSMSHKGVLIVGKTRVLTVEWTV